MDIRITFEYNEKYDGFSGSYTTHRRDVDDLTTAAQFLADSFRGGGFTQVVDVGFEDTSGDVTFGGF